MCITVDCPKWTQSQAIFLLTHYQIMGDVEIAELLNRRFPRESLPWTRKHVAKKRARMELYRTPEQLVAIRARNTRQGRYNTEPARRAYKQERDQVTDKYIISNCLRHPIAKHDQIRKDHRLLIELIRRSIIQKRAIKQAELPLLGGEGQGEVNKRIDYAVQ